MRNFYGSCLLIAIIAFSGCQKEAIDKKPPVVKPTSSIADKSVSRLLYSDTLFYVRNGGGDYKILPVSKPVASGYFKANPIGLALDSLTGQINVTKSETGLRYKIYYLNAAGNALDSAKLVLSGIDYADSIYRLKTTATAYDTAFPIYNARPGLMLPCGDDDEDDDDDDDDDNKCVFDETDLNDDGNDDIAGVIQNKLLIDNKNGSIDLEASFHAGVFGSSNPANGVTKDFTFYYRLSDASNRALQKITVRLYHFKTVNDIPLLLLAELNQRKNISTQVNNRPLNLNGASRERSFSQGPKRPPFIIIVSS